MCLWRFIDLQSSHSISMKIMILLVGDPHMDTCLGWWCSYGSCSLYPKWLLPEWVVCHRQTRIRISVRRFTPANTGLDKPSTYPELGSSFKASFMKSALWFFAKVAMEISGKHPDENLFYLESFYLFLVGYLNWLPNLSWSIWWNIGFKCLPNHNSPL